MSEKEKTTSTGNAGSSTDAAKEQAAMTKGVDKAAASAGKFAAAGESSPEGGNADVQEKFDAINEKGYFGIKVDPTPNENYTASGVNEGKPTPETDPKQAAKAAEHAAKVRSGGMEPDE